MSIYKNVSFFSDHERDRGECELVGPENIIIPEGIYDASYLHHESCGMYGRRIKGDKSRLDKGKVYLWFWIDPYSKRLSLGNRAELYVSYNADSVIRPLGKGGKFRMARKGKYYQDYQRLFGVKRRDRISTSAFKNKLFTVKVGTVETDDRQKKHAPDKRYSIIREIISISN